ncbi:MAG: acyl-CoA dehydrogenase family protein [Trebonia sp.]
MKGATAGPRVRARALALTEDHMERPLLMWQDRLIRPQVTELFAFEDGPVLEGKTGWSMCFTEPAAGSDLAGIKTTAVHKGDHWVINGRKMWHTGHSGASYTAVAAVTDPSKGRRCGPDGGTRDQQPRRHASRSDHGQYWRMTDGSHHCR